MQRITQRSQDKHGTFFTYTVGFILSIVLTLATYVIVHKHVVDHHLTYTHHAIVLVIMGLAVVQLMVQLFFFLHLGREDSPKWNTQIFLFMAVILLILVVGSLWIMDNLNYHMMTPEETKLYMHEHEGF